MVSNTTSSTPTGDASGAGLSDTDLINLGRNTYNNSNQNQGPLTLGNTTGSEIQPTFLEEVLSPSELTSSERFDLYNYRNTAEGKELSGTVSEQINELLFPRYGATTNRDAAFENIVNTVTNGGLDGLAANDFILNEIERTAGVEIMNLPDVGHLISRTYETFVPVDLQNKLDGTNGLMSAGIEIAALAAQINGTLSEAQSQLITSGKDAFADNALEYDYTDNSNMGFVQRMFADPMHYNAAVYGAPLATTAENQQIVSDYLYNEEYLTKEEINDYYTSQGLDPYYEDTDRGVLQAIAEFSRAVIDGGVDTLKDLNFEYKKYFGGEIAQNAIELGIQSSSLGTVSLGGVGIPVAFILYPVISAVSDALSPDDGQELRDFLAEDRLFGLIEGLDPNEEITLQDLTILSGELPDPVRGAANILDLAANPMKIVEGLYDNLISNIPVVGDLLGNVFGEFTPETTPEERTAALQELYTQAAYNQLAEDFLNATPEQVEDYLQRTSQYPATYDELVKRIDEYFNEQFPEETSPQTGTGDLNDMNNEQTTQYPFTDEASFNEWLDGLVNFDDQDLGPTPMHEEAFRDAYGTDPDTYASDKEKQHDRLIENLQNQLTQLRADLEYQQLRSQGAYDLDDFGTALSKAMEEADFKTRNEDEYMAFYDDFAATYEPFIEIDRIRNQIDIYERTIEREEREYTTEDQFHDAYMDHLDEFTDDPMTDEEFDEFIEDTQKTQEEFDEWWKNRERPEPTTPPGPYEYKPTYDDEYSPETPHKIVDDDGRVTYTNDDGLLLHVARYNGGTIEVDENGDPQYVPPEEGDPNFYIPPGILDDNFDPLPDPTTTDTGGKGPGPSIIVDPTPDPDPVPPIGPNDNTQTDFGGNGSDPDKDKDKDKGKDDPFPNTQTTLGGNGDNGETNNNETNTNTQTNLGGNGDNNNQSDNNQSDNNQSDNNQSDNNQSDNNQFDNNQSDNNQFDTNTQRGVTDSPNLPSVPRMDTNNPNVRTETGTHSNGDRTTITTNTETGLSVTEVVDAETGVITTAWVDPETGNRINIRYFPDTDFTATQINDSDGNLVSFTETQGNTIIEYDAETLEVVRIYEAGDDSETSGADVTSGADFGRGDVNRDEDGGGANEDGMYMHPDGQLRSYPPGITITHSPTGQNQEPLNTEGVSFYNPVTGEEWIADRNGYVPSGFNTNWLPGMTSEDFQDWLNGGELSQEAMDLARTHLSYADERPDQLGRKTREEWLGLGASVDETSTGTQTVDTGTQTVDTGTPTVNTGTPAVGTVIGTPGVSTGTPGVNTGTPGVGTVIGPPPTDPLPPAAPAPLPPAAPVGQPGYTNVELGLDPRFTTGGPYTGAPVGAVAYGDEFDPTFGLLRVLYGDEIANRYRGGGLAQVDAQNLIDRYQRQVERLAFDRTATLAGQEQNLVNTLRQIQRDSDLGLLRGYGTDYAQALYGTDPVARRQLQYQSALSDELYNEALGNFSPSRQAQITEDAFQTSALQGRQRDPSMLYERLLGSEAARADRQARAQAAGANTFNMTRDFTRQIPGMLLGGGYDPAGDRTISPVYGAIDAVGAAQQNYQNTQNLMDNARAQAAYNAAIAAAQRSDNLSFLETINRAFNDFNAGLATVDGFFGVLRNLGGSFQGIADGLQQVTFPGSAGLGDAFQVGADAATSVGSIPVVTPINTTNPVVTNPVVTNPVVTDPAETDPTETDPTETDPTETDPTEGDPTEGDPANENTTDTNTTDTNTTVTENADVYGLNEDTFANFDLAGFERDTDEFLANLETGYNTFDQAQTAANALLDAYGIGPSSDSLFYDNYLMDDRFDATESDSVINRILGIGQSVIGGASNVAGNVAETAVDTVTTGVDFIAEAAGAVAGFFGNLFGD